MTVFDAGVVIFAIFEIVLDFLDKFAGVKNVIPIFRLFKLARAIPTMRKIISTLAQSLADVFYLSCLLLLFVLIFLLLGMELFGGQYPRPELNYTREHFPNLFDSDKLTWD